MAHRRLHTNVKPFSCPLCPRSFCAKPHLVRHMEVHGDHTSAAPVRKHECSYCDKAFASRDACNKHSQICRKNVDYEVLIP